jgi:CMP-N-acetylneuraminic acid synthetase
MKKIIALVPMKEHSERVPNKNMRDFCGKPLYHRVVEALLASRYIKELYIDTDSKQIKEDVQSYFEQIKIIDRPEDLRGDLVPMNDIIAYDLSQLKGEHFLQTHSTNPLLTTRIIDHAIETYFENLNRCDSLFSVTRLQTRLYWKDGKPINHNPQELIRTQDLPSVYEENSNLYIFSKVAFQKNKRRIGETPYLFEMDKIEAIDIDEEADFIMAEALYRIKHLKEKKL